MGVHLAKPARHARYDFSLSIKPTGNKAADSYVNRWADGDNTVDAVTQVVERKVNGVAWFDTNHDGIRQDSDRLLADVTVTLVDGNGRTVTSVSGKPCTATTDRNGHYEIGSIPAGSGFKLRFTPETGTAWHGRTSPSRTRRTPARRPTPTATGRTIRTATWSPASSR